MKVTTDKDVTLLELDEQGPVLGSDRDASDVLSEAFSADATVVVIPVGRLDPAFFDLRSGLAGNFFQKMQNYERRLVILGDIAERVAASKALHDFVYETNRHGNHLFVPDRQTMLARL